MREPPRKPETALSNSSTQCPASPPLLPLQHLPLRAQLLLNLLPSLLIRNPVPSLVLELGPFPSDEVGESFAVWSVQASLVEVVGPDTC